MGALVSRGISCIATELISNQCAHGGGPDGGPTSADAGLPTSLLLFFKLGKLVQVVWSFCWPTEVVSSPVPHRYSMDGPQPWEAACCCGWDSKGGSSPLAWHGPLPQVWGMGSNLPSRRRCRWSAAYCHHWLLLGSSPLSCPAQGQHIFSFVHLEMNNTQRF